MIYTTDILGYQWDILVKAFVLGILLGGCYLLMRMGTIILRFGKKSIPFLDFLFWVFGGFIIFSFLLNENFGIPRFYIFFGIGAGFFAVCFVFGKISERAAGIIGTIIRKIFSPFVKILRKIYKKIGKKAKETKINLIKLIGGNKRLLKKKSGLVYNILCLNIQKAFSFCGGKAGKEPEKVESNGTEKTEKERFSQNCSYCLRNISSVHPDINAGEHQRKT